MQVPQSARHLPGAIRGELLSLLPKSFARAGYYSTTSLVVADALIMRVEQLELCKNASAGLDYALDSLGYFTAMLDLTGGWNCFFEYPAFRCLWARLNLLL